MGVRALGRIYVSLPEGAGAGIFPFVTASSTEYPIQGKSNPGFSGDRSTDRKTTYGFVVRVGQIFQPS